VKPRFVDAVLLVALLIVGGGIVWTMLTLGEPATPVVAAPASSPTPNDEALDASASALGGGSVVPLEPGGAIGPVAGESDDVQAEGVGPEPSEAAGAEIARDASDARAEEVVGDVRDNELIVASAPAASAEAAAPPGLEPQETAGGVEPTAAAGADVGAPAADATGRPNPDVPAAEAAPVPPDGEVALGRVGYAFVTGGPGACGVVMEPWQHVAVSRELLAAYGCGRQVTIRLDDGVGDAATIDVTIADTMNDVWSRTANIYVGSDEPALSYGLTTGTITPR